MKPKLSAVKLYIQGLQATSGKEGSALWFLTV